MLTLSDRLLHQLEAMQQVGERAFAEYMGSQPDAIWIHPPTDVDGMSVRTCLNDQVTPMALVAIDVEGKHFIPKTPDANR